MWQENRGFPTPATRAGLIGRVGRALRRNGMALYLGCIAIKQRRWKDGTMDGDIGCVARLAAQALCHEGGRRNTSHVCKINRLIN
jgi:hypothetical protein